MGIYLRKKKLAGGRLSLFLDYCHNGIRYRKYLGIILEKPKDSPSREANRKKWELALSIRAKCELNILAGNHGIPTQEKRRNESLLEVFREFKEQYTQKDKNVVKALHNHIKNFLPDETITLAQADETFCRRFYEYLKIHLKGYSPTNYYRKFKQFFQICVDRQWLSNNPAHKIRLRSTYDIKKEILTFEEIETLAQTPCKNADVKKAFLFSCNTGIRWCDITRLTPANIDRKLRLLTFTQRKTEGNSSVAVVHINLNSNAMMLTQTTNEQKRTKPIFSLPSYNYTLRIIQQWVVDAGISKHITYHCARHSFITNLVIKGTDIKTVSSLAGHSSTRHTEKYIHLIDSRKEKAVDSFPTFHLTETR